MLQPCKCTPCKYHVYRHICHFQLIKLLCYVCGWFFYNVTNGVCFATFLLYLSLLGFLTQWTQPSQFTVNCVYSNIWQYLITANCICTMQILLIVIEIKLLFYYLITMQCSQHKCKDQSFEKMWTDNQIYAYYLCILMHIILSYRVATQHRCKDLTSIFWEDVDYNIQCNPAQM